MYRNLKASLGSLACLGLFAVPLCGMAEPQFDAEHYVLKELFAEKWADDDAEVESKLADLESRFGKKPNIIKILVDDVGYSELGAYGGGKLRGAPTPNLDKMANQGMRFLQYYSEPSCTPTRIALVTGRHAVRTGVNEPLFPGTAGIGLPDDEVALAEVMSAAGYHTGMFGKWHIGFGDEYAPTRHGFDEAEWSEGNPAPWVTGIPGDEPVGHVTNRAISWAPKNSTRYYDEGGVLRAKKGETPQEVYPYTAEKYNTYEEEVFDRSIDFINRHAGSDKPFFLYVGGKANHFFGAHPDFMDSPAQTNTAAQMMETDYNAGRLIKALYDNGIAENTLVVWTSDNGPHYGFHPHGGYSMFDFGEKGQTFEGGVRVPAIAWWPGVIDAGQDPLDIFHVTDWYTTFARIAGKMDMLPSDRIVDGVDQSALLMLGEDHGRRDYLFLYAKGQLEAVRKDWIKIRFGGKVFVPHYNLMHDPAERHPKEVNYIDFSFGMGRMIQEHAKLIEQFPHTVQKAFQREPDLPFDPSPSVSYAPAKSVEW